MEAPKFKLSIFSLDLTDDNGVTVALFPPVAKAVTEDETKVIVEHAKAIERICFAAMQRSVEVTDATNIVNFAAKTEKKRRSKKEI